MKRLYFIIFILCTFNLLNAQNLSVYKEDISPAGITKIGGISWYNNEIYLILQSNLLFNGKEIEASEAINISQKYPVWDIYKYNPETGIIKNESARWNTTGASPNGFCIVDESSVIFINDKNQLDSNNKELKKVLNKFQSKKNIFADPTINSNKSKLWFSADLPGSKGGMDLWFVEKKGSEWGNPVNAGNKINSADNDISPAVFNDSILIFSSNREGKDYDLHFFNLKTNAMLHQEVIPDSNEFFTSITPDGMFAFLSRKGKDTKLWKGRWSLVRSSEIEVMESPKIENVSEVILPKQELVLETPEAKTIDNTNIQMTNYFGIARYDLTPLMKDSLTRLAQTMKNDPELSILICGHASPDGPENLNMMLSYYRATEAYNWLISKNIDDSRIYRVYGGEYIFNDSQKARNFSIFTLQTPELPRQIALYPLINGENENEVAGRFETNMDDMSYQRYQLNKFLPIKDKRLLLIPVNVLYLAKAGEKVSDVARQYNLPPTRLMKMNKVEDDTLKEDRILFIVY